MRGTASTLVAGRYRLDRPLRSGACATLWRAVDEVLARPVAVKILDAPEAVPGCSSVEEAVALYTGSALSAGRLAHPTIASTYDAGTDDDLPYIVTEWVDGRPLADLASADRPIAAGQAAHLVVQVADAVAFAHASGVTHGDLDASNVIVCADGAVKITDFAVGAALCDRSPPAALEGLGDELRDTRAVAALLYLLLTGRSAYGAEPAVPPAPRHDPRTPRPPGGRRRSPRAPGRPAPPPPPGPIPPLPPRPAPSRPCSSPAVPTRWPAPPMLLGRERAAVAGSSVARREDQR